MAKSELRQNRLAKGLVFMTFLLLVGIVVLAAGHLSGNRIAFYAGVFVTLAGVLNGIHHLVVRNRSRRIDS